MMEELYLEHKDTEWPLESINHDRNVVRAITYDEDGFFYFVRVDRDDLFGKAKHIETVGSGVEEGEDLEEALRCELKEELGASIDIIAKIGVVSDFYNVIHRHNITNYYLCKVTSFGKTEMTPEEINEFHLTRAKLTYEEAVNEYERCNDTKIGRLICRRELPVLKRAHDLMHDCRRP
ncbi:MAG: NUDIX hydrolase [Treponema sp.]|nr:NUDIX hydrolase [Treponema sp.]